MDWRRARRSQNVEVRGGGRRAMRAGGGLGLGGIALVVGLGLALGRSPAEILGFLVNMGGGEISTGGGQSSPPSPEQAREIEFVSAILGSTEDAWAELFEAGGQRYTPPRLVVFQGAVDSACGRASSSVGPFYCPADSQVYLDLAFFHDLEQRYRAEGDLARAYVIAHEVGHHVQNLTGVAGQVARARAAGSPTEGADGLSVRQELQADCYAGLWAQRSEEKLRWLEPGDVESALAAATAIGDDALQKQAQGYAVPDSFTHGSSEQRVRWFKVGMKGGRVADCDTFRAKQL
ncbi:MAG: neutral zinc metallopeptidase [Candidatus Binatia bacterium]